MKISNLRGTKDIFGQGLKKFEIVQNCAKKLAENYMFLQVDTPIIECTELFAKNLGQESDVISKEIYSFADKSGKNICLRPEFTAAVVRSFVQNFTNWPLPVKLFSTGPLFRYDRPQRGRFRQFHQVNFEIIGAKTYHFEIEIILLVTTFLEELNIKYYLEINSLGCQKTKESYRDQLRQYFAKYKEHLCDDSIKRLEKDPIRILDSKDKGDQQVASNAPRICDFYTKEATENFALICKRLEILGINHKVTPKLVRGLDYYSGLIFEFKTDQLGAQNTLAAGGRYDNLVQSLGGKSMPAIGFAAGIERLMEVMPVMPPDEKIPISVVCIGKDTEIATAKVVLYLRRNGFKTQIHYDASLKSQMKRAQNSKYCIILGEDEAKQDSCIIKCMQDGSQKKVKLDELKSALEDF